MSIELKNFIKTLSTREENGETVVIPTQSNIKALLSQITKYLVNYHNNTTKLPEAQKKMEEGLKTLAHQLSDIVSKGINDGELLSDTYGILGGKVTAASMPKVNKKYLTMFNNYLSTYKAEQIESKPEEEVLSSIQKAEILAMPLSTVDGDVTEVEVKKGEWLFIDKVKGTVTLWIEKTNTRITKEIEDFKKKTWRQVASGIIERIVQFFADCGIKVQKGFVSFKTKVKSIFSRKPKATVASV